MRKGEGALGESIMNVISSTPEVNTLLLVSLKDIYCTRSALHSFKDNNAVNPLRGISWLSAIG